MVADTEGDKVADTVADMVADMPAYLIFLSFSCSWLTCSCTIYNIHGGRQGGRHGGHHGGRPKKVLFNWAQSFSTRT